MRLAFPLHTWITLALLAGPALLAPLLWEFSSALRWAGTIRRLTPARLPRQWMLSWVGFGIIALAWALGGQQWMPSADWPPALLLGLSYGVLVYVLGRVLVERGWSLSAAIGTAYLTQVILWFAPLLVGFCFTTSLPWPTGLSLSLSLHPLWFAAQVGGPDWLHLEPFYRRLGLGMLFFSRFTAAQAMWGYWVAAGLVGLAWGRYGNGNCGK